MNLELERFKYTDKDLDFTIIEIIEKDNINNFLEIDKYINSKDYKDEHIFSVQFPGGKNIKISPGKIICKKEPFFLYTLGTEGGSSGSPIILIENSKIIALHKAGYIKNKKKKNIGIPMNLIINKIKLKYKSCSSSKIIQSLIKFLDSSDTQNHFKGIRISLNSLTEKYSKQIRIFFDGLIGVGKSQVLNCIIGENILPIRIECTFNRGIILKYQETNDFYLYRAHLIERTDGINFFENEKDFDCKGVDNIRSYLVNNNNEKNISDKDEFFIIKGRLKIFNFIKFEDQELIKKIEFIELPQNNTFICFSSKNKIIEYSNCIINVNDPMVLEDMESLKRIQINYLSNKSKVFVTLRENFIKNNLFLINKSDILDEKDKDKIEKRLFQHISTIENNLIKSDMNISFFSGKFFMHFLEIYNDYVENLENDPNLFFEKIFQKFKENNNTDKSLENFFCKNLKHIEEIFGLDLKEEINIPEEYKNKLLKSFKEISKSNNIEINNEKTNEIISNLYGINKNIKNKDFSHTNYSCEFFDKLKILIMNNVLQQKLHFKNEILHILSDMDSIFSEISETNYESTKNKIINQLNEYCNN